MAMGLDVRKIGSLAEAIGRGLAAGVAGTALMTLSSTLESKLRGREPSNAPAQAAGRTLGVEPRDEAARQRFATVVRRELHEWHKPRTIGAVEEAPDRVRHLLGDRARLFGNLPRLNELLKLVQLHLLRLDDPNDYARILRENHLAHGGTPPPRRQHDGAGLRAVGPAARSGTP